MELRAVYCRAFCFENGLENDIFSDYSIILDILLQYICHVCKRFNTSLFFFSEKSMLLLRKLATKESGG